MPFGSAPSIDWSVLPPLETKPAAGPASFGDLENAGLLPKAQKQLYRLALIEADGSLRIPTDNELQALITGARLPASPPPPPVRAQPAAAAHHQQPGAREPTFQELLAATAEKGGPVCAHCGVTESPQWRRGPPQKSILCNACGTRYRRTNQLGSAVPSAQRKRQAQAMAHHSHCGADALKHHNGHGPAAKQPRVSVA